MSEQLTQATRETKENVKKTAEIDKDVDFLMNKMQSLESEVNATERYSRSYNARFLGVSEITGEHCARESCGRHNNKIGRSGQTIGHAHRIGKPKGNQPRQIIVRFFSRQIRAVKAPLHDTIPPHGACRLPCTWVNRNVWHVARMSRTPENRVKRIYSSFYFRADSAARAVRLPNQSAADT